MEWWRPVVSGLIGGLVATGLTYLARRRLPRKFRRRLVVGLLGEYRWHLRFCAAVFFGSLLVGIGVYKLGYARSNDWRPLAVAFGAGMVLPTVCMYFWLSRERFAEFWMAAAAKEGIGHRLMTALFILSCIAMFAGLGASI